MVENYCTRNISSYFISNWFLEEIKKKYIFRCNSSHFLFILTSENFSTTFLLTEDKLYVTRVDGQKYLYIYIYLFHTHTHVLTGRNSSWTLRAESPWCMMVAFIEIILHSSETKCFLKWNWQNSVSWNVNNHFILCISLFRAPWYLICEARNIVFIIPMDPQ